MRADLQARPPNWPVADDPPARGSDGRWHSPAGQPITLVEVLSWNRPAQQEGVPLTAYYCAAERRYWVHKSGGLGGTEFWFGPFDLP
jgi:hypothetical protein